MAGEREGGRASERAMGRLASGREGGRELTTERSAGTEVGRAGATAGRHTCAINITYIIQTGCNIDAGYIARRQQQQQPCGLYKCTNWFGIHLYVLCDILLYI